MAPLMSSMHQESDVGSVEPPPLRRKDPHHNTPVVKTLSDDDLHEGDDDSCATTAASTDGGSLLDALDEGRENHEILSSINSIHIPSATVTPSSDVLEEVSDSIPEPDAPPLEDDDDDAPRAQIDTGGAVR